MVRGETMSTLYVVSVPTGYKEDMTLRARPVPGPWDAIACLALSGLPADRFAFMGQVPSAPAQRRAAFQAAADERQTLVWRVAAGGLPAALRDAKAVLGQRRLVVCDTARVWRGRLGDPLPSTPTGGYLIVEGASDAPDWPAARVRERVRALRASGVSARDAARTVADLSGWRRKQVYQVAVELSAALEDG
jgi:16S rRNA (cytidine1402-2'-O)-methyltransferase